MHAHLSVHHYILFLLCSLEISHTCILSSFNISRFYSSVQLPYLTNYIGSAEMEAAIMPALAHIWCFADLTTKEACLTRHHLDVSQQAALQSDRPAFLLNVVLAHNCTYCMCPVCISMTS